MATIREIVDDAQEIIGEVAGSGTQTYGEDQLMKHAIRCFDFVWKKYPWHQYVEWTEHDLDGVLGIVDEDAFTHVRDFEDFLAVYPSTSDKELPLLPRSTNPFRLSGSRMLFWTALPATDDNYATRRLQFWPKTAEGSVNVCARIYPTLPLTWDSELFLDKTILVHGTAFMSLSGDDVNPQSAMTQRSLMEDRFNTITGALAGRPIALRGSMGVPTDWYQR